MNRAAALALICVLLVAGACRGRQDGPGQAPRVACTIFPVYDMVREVGGGRVSPVLLVRPGVEAHSFEPRPQDAAAASSASALAYAGETMEPWVADFARGLGRPGPRVFDLSNGIMLERHITAAGAVPDPHFWLDFSAAEKMAENTASALSAVSPADHDYYYANLAAFKTKLVALDRKYAAALSGCRGQRLIYAGHFSFGYLATRYGLEYVALGDVSPEAEPSPARLALLASAARSAHAKTVFYEELSSPKFAAAIAGETGASVAPLNPMHEITPALYASGADYFSIMEDNLKTLSRGLACAK